MQTTTRLQVSVLIPCYNAESWVGEAIESALAQSYSQTEVVVYNDGSTDDSLDIIKQYDGQIRWGTGPNQGGGPARNWLLNNASYDWIQYLDADDYLESDKIANQVEALTSGKVSSDVDVLYGPVTFQHHESDGTRRHLEPVVYPDDPWASLVTWDLPQTGSPLWRKSALEDVEGWKDDQPVCQEHELYLRLLMASKKFTYTNTNGAVYRQWSEETVCRTDQSRTYRHRLAIMRRAEEFLIEQDMMTPMRRRALNRAYLECSRMIWLFNRDWAQSIIAHMEKMNEKSFQPSDDQVPRTYRWLYRIFGFNTAERVASWKRKLVS
jgi:glycosyltransferase involved in cell wall biosynthesis